MSYNPYKNLVNPYADQVSDDAVYDYFHNPARSIGKSNNIQNRNYELWINARNWEHDREMAAADYDANSYPTVVRQMLEAGLNPDLLGAPQGSQSSSTSEYNPVSLQQEANDIARANNLVNAGNAVVGAASSVYQSYLQTKQVGASVDLSRTSQYNVSLDSLAREQEFINDYMLHNMPASLLEKMTSQTPDDVADSDAIAMLESFISDSFQESSFIQNTGLPEDVAKRLSSRMRSRLNSPESLANIYRSLSEYSRSRQEYMQDISSPLWSESYVPNDAMEARSKVMAELYEFSSRFNADYFRELSGAAKAASENAEYRYNENYFDEADPAAKASSETRKYNFEQDSADLKATLLKISRGYMRSNDPLCRLQGQNIMQFLYSTNWMTPYQWLVNAANELGLAGGQILNTAADLLFNPFSGTSWNNTIELLQQGPAGATYPGL